MHTLKTELLKLAGLPSAWGAVLFGLTGPPLVALLNSRNPAAGGVGQGFMEMAFGALSAIILGVVTVGSEYRTGQLATSLTCVPSRLRFLVSKGGALVLVVAPLAVVTAVLTLTVSGSLNSAAVPRIGGGVVYWVLYSLLAFSITLLTRSGIVPLVVLMLNSSVVSVSYLLSRVFSAANYLPDLAGAHLVVRDMATSGSLDPLTGGLVMAGWVVALLAIATVVFHRRDA